MRAPGTGQPRKRWVLAIAAFVSVIASVAVCGSTFASDSPQGGTEWKQQLREQEKKQFLREHSDASGKPRPDLWRKGIEQQKQMQVAPYIGWHPATTSHGKPASADKP